MVNPPSPNRQVGADQAHPSAVPRAAAPPKRMQMTIAVPLPHKGAHNASVKTRQPQGPPWHMRAGVPPRDGRFLCSAKAGTRKGRPGPPPALDRHLPTADGRPMTPGGQLTVVARGSLMERQIWYARCSPLFLSGPAGPVKGERCRFWTVRSVTSFAFFVLQLGKWCIGGRPQSCDVRFRRRSRMCPGAVQSAAVVESRRPHTRPFPQFRCIWVSSDDCV